MKRKFPRLAVLAVFAMLALGVSMPAEAVSVGLSGSVYSAGANPFGIVLSSTLSGGVTYDPILAASAPGGLLNYTADPTMALGVQIGTFSFDSTTDPFTDLTLGFTSGILSNISLLGATGTGGWGLEMSFPALGDPNSYFMIDTSPVTQITGTVTANVPVPATLLLVITGAATVAGAGWRRARQS